MNSDSRRVKMTKRILKETLLDLMEEKEIGKITIKEICDLADVNRSTFYAHYESPIELLEEVENDIVNETPRINLYRNEPIREELTTFFEYIEKNKRECRVLFRNSTASRFQTKILDKIFGKSESKPQWITGFDLHNDVHVKMLMSAYGGLAIVEQWIFDKVDCSAHELADAISSYVQKA